MESLENYRPNHEYKATLAENAEGFVLIQGQALLSPSCKINDNNLRRDREIKNSIILSSLSS